MPEISKTFIVIPCYNEEKAISGIEYSRFLQNHSLFLTTIVYSETYRDQKK